MTLIETLQKLATSHLDKAEDSGCGMFNYTLIPSGPVIESTPKYILLQIYPFRNNLNFGQMHVLCYDNAGEHKDYDVEDLTEQDIYNVIALFKRQISKEPVVMPFTELTDIALKENADWAGKLIDAQRALKQNARNAVAAILSVLPGKQVVSEGDAIGYVHYQSLDDDWVERGIHAIRLGEHNVIQVACDLDYDENDKPTVNDWTDENREMTFDEYDHYSSIDWLNTYDMLVRVLSQK